jgi:hypothetical protein
MTQFIRRLYGANVEYWRNATMAQKFLFISGSLLFASMFFHGIVLVITGGPLNGPVSFRKAMTFAETLGLTCWVVAWMLPFFRLSRRGAWIVAGATTVFALSEVTLFAIQVWRGVPSHYNFTTIFDAAVFSSTGIGAGLFTVLTIVLLVRSARLTPATAPSLRLAIRAGLVINLLGYVVGVMMALNSGGIWQGTEHLQQMLVAERAGRYLGPAEDATGGNLVMIHAIGVHGLQLVPLAAWLLLYSPWSERRRYGLTAAVATSTVVLMAALTVQAFRGLPLSQIDPATALFVAASGLTLLGSYAAVGWATLRGLGSRGRAMAGQLAT